MLAIQETALPGRSLSEKLAMAASLDIQGVEFDANQLRSRVPEVTVALQQARLRASAVHMGRADGYLSPLLDEREAAISDLRQAMADALDLGTQHVIFVPHYGPLRMPDLRPYRSSLELTREIMVWLLRTVADLAYAMGVTLHIQPLNRQETGFLRRIDQAVTLCDQIKRHRHVRIAPSWRDMQLEEAEPAQALQAAGKLIGYVHLSESSTRSGDAALASALKTINYAGWVTLTGREPVDRAQLEGRLSQICNLGLSRAI